MQARIIFILLMAILFPVAGGQGFNWENARPEEMGFSSGKLYAMRDTVAKYNTTSILVMRNDRIVLEWYAPEWNERRKHYTASLAKALVGGMSLLLALDDGRMNVDDPVCRYIPVWVLKLSGYNTYMSGKWHIGSKPEVHPRERGFDRNFGLIDGGGS